MSLITLFSIPRAFDDQWSIIQANAINSWKQLGDAVEIILIGDDPGVSDFAAGAGLKHISGVKCNEFETPLLSSTFQLAVQNSQSPLMGYVNCDIILLAEFVQAIERVKGHFDGLRQSDFLAIGRRTNLFVDRPFDFSDQKQIEDLRKLASSDGQLDSVVCKDYFVFPRTKYAAIPEFAVGRGNWDNWMLASAKAESMPVVSMTECVLAIHQMNEVTHTGITKYRNYVAGAEAKTNQRLAGGRNLVRGSTSTHRLTCGEIVKNRWHQLGCEFWLDFPKFARLLGGFVGK